MYPIKTHFVCLSNDIVTRGYQHEAREDETSRFIYVRCLSTWIFAWQSWKMAGIVEPPIMSIILEIDPIVVPLIVIIIFH